MCGIAGIIDKRGRYGPEGIRAMATAMADKMIHRGPDGGGVWLSPDGMCALSHRRLAVIDTTEGGHQPMLARGGQVGLTFNGEIYNFLELKADLEARGARFATRSDTEVLLTELLSSPPADVLGKLDGMFAFALYDTDKRELVIGRDIFGEKPVYYIDNDDILAFSSELHALAGLPNFDAGIDLETIAAFLCYQYVPAPQTIYRSARKLPPASILTWRAGEQTRAQRYFRFRTSDQQSSRRSMDDLADELEEVMTRSIRRRLISDVPLGAFLSGGVDSSTVAALVTKKMGLPLKTFSIGFADHAESEHFEAAEIGAYLGTEHSDQIIEGYALGLGEVIANNLDEPNADSSCLPTYLVSRHAREHVTVALSGDGGDELFGGYNRYFNTVQEQAAVRAGDPSLGWWRLGEVYLGNRILVFPENALNDALGGTPPQLQWALDRDRLELEADERPLLNVLRESDALTYLPGDVLAKVDRMSMQHSLEVRAPFLGIEMAKFSMGLAADDCYQDGQGKRVLKHMASRYLPEAWLKRPKRGFGLPTNLWDQQALLPQTREMLMDSGSRLSEWVPRQVLHSYMDTLSQSFSPYRAWTFFILEQWLRTHAGRPV